MRAVVQRVIRAAVEADGRRLGAIGPGLLVLVGVHREDARADAEFVARKVASLRIFPDEEGRMHHSVLEAGGAVMVVSQFTLYADTRRGRRPSFAAAAPAEVAAPLVRYVAEVLRSLGVETHEGTFGAHMMVELVNDGPVTILVDSRPEEAPT